MDDHNVKDIDSASNPKDSYNIPTGQAPIMEDLKIIDPDSSLTPTSEIEEPPVFMKIFLGDPARNVDNTNNSLNPATDANAPATPNVKPANTATTNDASIPSPPKPLCVICARPTKYTCQPCLSSVDSQGNPSPTHYCTRKCQNEHYGNSHKHQCQSSMDRRQLFRIGALVQETFYELTRVMWYDGIAEVGKIDSMEGDQMDDGAEVLLKRYKKHDGVDFPLFPKRMFLDLEKSVEQAVLTTAAGNGAVVSELLGELVKQKGSGMKIVVDEVPIDPRRTARSVRFAEDDDTASDKSPMHWVFRAILPNGETFAIDPCNAQYSCTTPQERSHGVFPWESYMQRLSVSKPSGPQRLGHHAPNLLADPVGSVAACEANLFADEDIRSSAERMAVQACFSAARKIARKTKKKDPDVSLLNTLTSRWFSDEEHGEHAQEWRELLSRAAGRVRANGIKDTVGKRVIDSEKRAAGAVVEFESPSYASDY